VRFLGRVPLLFAIFSAEFLRIALASNLGSIDVSLPIKLYSHRAKPAFGWTLIFINLLILDRKIEL